MKATIRAIRPKEEIPARRLQVTIAFTPIPTFTPTFANQNIPWILQDASEPAANKENDSGKQSLHVLGRSDIVKNRKSDKEICHEHHCAHIRTPESNQRTDEDQPVSSLSKIVITENGVVIIKFIHGVRFISFFLFILLSDLEKTIGTRTIDIDHHNR